MAKRKKKEKRYNEPLDHLRYTQASGHKETMERIKKMLMEFRKKRKDNL